MARPATTNVEKRRPGRYGYGDGLWLEATTPTRRAWFLRYTRRGKARMMSLGDARHIDLREGREKATDAQKLLAQDIDPLDDRRARREADAVAKVRQTTFS